MEATFITIHDLTPEARILYSSDSIVDVLGHTPDEIIGKSTWEYFKQSDVQSAQKLHGRSVVMDKASVLTYCDIRNRQGLWVRCECCFSVVYNVMVACTSLYQHAAPTAASINRQSDAPVIRRMFASSPKDPRYHMLQHLSARFDQPVEDQSHEPRAALFLNRFTRTLTVMYATSGIEEIIGISSEDMKGRSFYYLIADACLQDAVKCLESAKGNDSIAYLRFHFRNRQQNDSGSQAATSGGDTDAEMTDVDIAASDSEAAAGSGNTSNQTGSGGRQSTSASGEVEGDSAPTSVSNGTNRDSTPPDTSVELEAVVSCTSDGLVVCLRRARPQVTPYIHDREFFAAPWPAPTTNPLFHPSTPAGFGGNTYAGMPAAYGGPTVATGAPVGGPDPHDFLRAIREVAVFAWALTGINGSLAEYARGTPAGDAIPKDGIQIWDPSYSNDSGFASGPNP